MQHLHLRAVQVSVADSFSLGLIMFGPLGATLAGLVAEIYEIPILFAIGGITSSFLLLLFLNRVPSQLLQNLKNNAE